jgi:hypothetical protein
MNWRFGATCDLHVQCRKSVEQESRVQQVARRWYIPRNVGSYSDQTVLYPRKWQHLFKSFMSSISLLQALLWSSSSIRSPCRAVRFFTDLQEQWTATYFKVLNLDNEVGNNLFAPPVRCWSLPLTYIRPWTCRPHMPQIYRNISRSTRPPLREISAGKNSVRQCSIQPVNIVRLCSVSTHIMVSCNTVTIITVTVIIMVLSALSTDITPFLMMTDCVSMQRDFSVLFPRLRTSYIYIYIYVCVCVYTYILRERKIHVCNICFQDPQTWRIRSD